MLSQRSAQRVTVLLGAQGGKSRHHQAAATQFQSQIFKGIWIAGIGHDQALYNTYYTAYSTVSSSFSATIRDTFVHGEYVMNMTRRVALASGIGAVYLSAQTPGAPPSSTLKVGDKAPDFTLPSTNGGTMHLADYIGKSTVVLAFFPAAFSGG